MDFFAINQLHLPTDHKKISFLVRRRFVSMENKSQTEKLSSASETCRFFFLLRV
jgi:hypothetical protein